MYQEVVIDRTSIEWAEMAWLRVKPRGMADTVVAFRPDLMLVLPIAADAG